MSYDINAMLNQIAAKGKDMTQATAGGTYTPPPEGTALARFVGYFEVGKHETIIKGQKKTEDQAELVFELHGKNYPANEQTGEPLRMTLKVSVSLNEKSWLFKTFSAMNWQGTAKHITQLLGQPYLLNIKHDVRGEGENKRTYANIERGSIRKPFFQQMNAEGEVVDVAASVPGAKTPIKMFVWDFANEGMWDSIFIEGEYPERKDEKTGKVIKEAQSKNVIQNKIRSALNFKGLSIYAYASGEVKKDESESLDAALGAAGAPVNEPEPAADMAFDGDPMASIG